jgi:hypothetical protein
MKPRFYHYLTAHFPAIVAQAGGVALVSFASVSYAPLIEVDFGFSSLAGLALAVVAAYALGAIVSVIFVGSLVYPLIRRVVGAPFHEGDEVVILCGKRKGKITEVYEVWESRGEVRLRLSDDERESVTDVYSYYEVLKCAPANQVSRRDTSPGLPHHRACESAFGGIDTSRDRETPEGRGSAPRVGRHRSI